MSTFAEPGEAYRVKVWIMDVSTGDYRLEYRGPFKTLAAAKGRATAVINNHNANHTGTVEVAAMVEASSTKWDYVAGTHQRGKS